MNEILEPWFLELPKADLHCHLDGSLRIQTLVDLAKEQNIPLASHSPEELKRALKLGMPCENLADYLRVFSTTLSVLQDAASLERIAFELAEDAHQENVGYLEVRYSPALHTERGMRLDEVVEAVLRGLGRAKQKYGIAFGVIVCTLRHFPLETSMALAEVAGPFLGKGVVAFDLAGGEAQFPGSPHKLAFERALQLGLPITIHAGEAAGADSIREALHMLKACRLGHGVRLVEDVVVEEEVLKRRIPLECCPTSNVQTAAVADMKSHPLKRFIRQGMCATLNTDNRLVSDTTLSREYARAYFEMGLSIAELCVVARNGFEAAFMEEKQKEQMLAFVDERLLRLSAWQEPGKPPLPT
ncbi:MAG: adenosine deaminase [Proteobacteria bacterium]|nr:adenosine deaminase [Cystobacterineae bacterium]MCL2258772.1 adenosine deaminase [Cystobacterineae bacterium]MCL2314399.1 adenosine deaminase [Pseudomonadota bacterium]